MEKVEVKVSVAKEAHELAEAVKKLIIAVKEAVKDGFQPGMDIPVILAPNLPALLAGVDGLDKLGDELKEDKAAFLKAWLLAGADIAEALIKKA